jgi:DNA-binding transcriptional regulator YhcF (GntR family)
VSAASILQHGWGISATSSVPPFEQLRTRIADLAASGKLPAGSKLPPVRTLAADLSVAVNTVARAYRELEQAGILATHGRAGTVVATAGDDVAAPLADAAAVYAEAARRYSVPQAKALALVQAALDAHGIR